MPFVEGALGEPDRTEVGTHLRRCSNCQEEARQLKESILSLMAAARLGNWAERRDHVDPEQMSLYLEDQFANEAGFHPSSGLSEEASGRIRVHLAECRACGEELAMLRELAAEDLGEPAVAQQPLPRSLRLEIERLYPKADAGTLPARSTWSDLLSRMVYLFHPKALVTASLALVALTFGYVLTRGESPQVATAPTPSVVAFQANQEAVRREAPAAKRQPTGERDSEPVKGEDKSGGKSKAASDPTVAGQLDEAKARKAADLEAAQRSPEQGSVQHKVAHTKADLETGAGESAYGAKRGGTNEGSRREQPRASETRLRDTSSTVRTTASNPASARPASVGLPASRPADKKPSSQPAPPQVAQGPAKTQDDRDGAQVAVAGAAAPSPVQESSETAPTPSSDIAAASEGKDAKQGRQQYDAAGQPNAVASQKVEGEGQVQTVAVEPTVTGPVANAASAPASTGYRNDRSNNVTTRPPAPRPVPVRPVSVSDATQTAGPGSVQHTAVSQPNSAYAAAGAGGREESNRDSLAMRSREADLAPRAKQVARQFSTNASVLVEQRADGSVSVMVRPDRRLSDDELDKLRRLLRKELNLGDSDTVVIRQP
ncbi:MAG: hypothetical protein AB1758_21495 [Candidatus Eremiobacterota bacterium]